MIDYRLTQCPECESVGKSVDYFVLLKNEFDPFNNKKIFIEHEKMRSGGRRYTERECRVCKGSGGVLAFSK